MRKTTLEEVRNKVTEAFANNNLLSLCFYDDSDGCSAEILSVIDGFRIEGDRFGFYLNNILVNLNHFESVIYDECDNYYLLENPGVKIHLAIY